jgi:DNA-binding NtrC family response regulator
LRAILAANDPVALEDRLEALAHLAKFRERFHLLLPDLLIPQRSGRELGDKMTAVRSGAKVLLLSGYSEPLQGRENQADAESEILPVPFSMNSLAPKIREMLSAANLLQRNNATVGAATEPKKRKPHAE